MADDNHAERTEPASPKRLEQAREEGRVARSHELSTFAMLMAGGGGLWLLGSSVIGRLRLLLHDGLTLDARAAFDPAQMLVRLNDQFCAALWALAPLLILWFLVALAAPQALSGWTFSLKSLRVDFQRVDPLAGIGRLMSWHGAGELVKALAKVGLVASCAALVMWHYRDSLQKLALLPLETGIAETARIVAMSFLTMAGTLAIVVGADLPFQLWRHADSLKMTREEVRQEMKESEGDPQIKAAIRSQQRALARGRMMEEVPKASVIVVNPTHYAVALRSEGTGMSAPRVVAKGANLVAAAIRRLGEEHRVPVLEAPPLARALYRHVDIGAEIPAQFYTAVAEVLAYVFQLHRYREHGGAQPPRLGALDVPDDLHHERE